MKWSDVMWTCSKCKKNVTRGDERGDVRICDMKICPHCKREIYSKRRYKENFNESNK